ncbi:MAG: phosphoribosylanthranilate isomerase [Ruminococcus callidus]
MKIKFCGIRRLEDVAFCNELQPEYLGMILSAGFRRTISPETAEQLVKAKSRSIAAVGVFVNETPEHIAQVLKQVPLDVIQLHGSETAEIVSGVRWRTGLPIWKLYGYKPGRDRCAQQLGADRLILEGHVPGQAGGTGVTADWNLIAGARPSQSFLLAGGLTPENVAEAVSLVQPDGVDFSSGIETDGVKDYEKMKQIVTIIRGGYHG